MPEYQPQSSLIADALRNRTPVQESHQSSDLRGRVTSLFQAHTPNRFGFDPVLDCFIRLKARDIHVGLTASEYPDPDYSKDKLDEIEYKIDVAGQNSLLILKYPRPLIVSHDTYEHRPVEVRPAIEEELLDYTRVFEDMNNLPTTYKARRQVMGG